MAHGGARSANSAPADELAGLREILDADHVIDAETTADDVEELLRQFWTSPLSRLVP